MASLELYQPSTNRLSTEVRIMEENTCSSESWDDFNKFIGEWLHRFHAGESAPAGLNVSGTYKRYEPFFRAMWSLQIENSPYDKAKIIRMLKSNKSVRKSLLFEEADDSRDRVARLYAKYEEFLFNLWEEIHGRETEDHNVTPREPFGEWLYSQLPAATSPEHSKVRSSFAHDPLKAILPVQKKVTQEQVDAKLDDLCLVSKEQQFSITRYPDTKPPPDESRRLTWADWHCFLYGVRNSEGHGRIRKTLLRRGCLNEKRRTKLRNYLQNVIDDRKKKIDDHEITDEDQHLFWASDMIRLLTDMEYRLWKEQKLASPEPSDPVGVKKDRSHCHLPWSEFLEVKKDATCRTVFEECLSYTVKLWMPRMIRQLASKLVKTLIELADEPTPPK